MRCRGTVLFFAAFCAAGLHAAQRTFVSAADGSDLNPCTRPLPCRSFAAALPLTDTDGEVIVVDSGGYGVVTIAQSVSLISPDGVYAGITAPMFNNAVTVNADATAQVVLRNLVLNSAGGESGVRAQKVGTLYVERCAINRFQQSGILSVGLARVYVSD